jgi:hypothetical protein
MTSISDFLPEDIPELLKTSNEDIIFEEGINERQKFNKFYKKNIEGSILKFLPKCLNTIEEKTPSVAFIAGSRAWDKYFKNECKDNLVLEDLSALEENSILPGNYDIFCICTDKNKIDNIYTEICICFDNIISKLYDNKDVSSTYSLSYISNVGKEVNKQNKQKILSHKFYTKHLEKYCPINNDFSEEGCVFPECKAMHLELIYEPINKNVKKKKEDSFNGKVLLYFEVIYIDDGDAINIINKELISECGSDSSIKMKYLNLTGLYMFTELIFKRHKEYDVDLYRKRILEKVLVRYNIEPKRMYLKIITLYKILFNSRQDYKFKLGILLKNLIDIYDNELIPIFNSNITEALRPYINTFVINVNNILNFKKNNYIFITGGDAYRRYVEDITRTNDIDAKIIYNKASDKNMLIDLITNKLSELIAILYKNKNNIFKDLESDIISLDKNSITLNIQFKPLYSIKDEHYSKDEQYSKDDSNAGQFRLRFIDKENLTLFSIDYRMKINVYLKVGDLEINTILNHDIAVLDVVLAKSDLDYSFAVKMSNGLPIASSQYLQEDLKGIYKEITENLKLRFHKSSKDRSRFIILIDYIKKAKKLLEHSRDSKLKRKVEELLDNIDNISKRQRKEVMYKSNDSIESMDIDIYDNIVLDIANFKNYPILYKNTLDKSFYNIHYVNSIVKYKYIIDKYANMLLDKIKENEKLDVDIKDDKIQLSFNDIYDVFSRKEKIIEESMDLFSKLTI